MDISEGVKKLLSIKAQVSIRSLDTKGSGHWAVLAHTPCQGHVEDLVPLDQQTEDMVPIFFFLRVCVVICFVI